MERGIIAFLFLICIFSVARADLTPVPNVGKVCPIDITNCCDPAYPPDSGQCCNIQGKEYYYQSDTANCVPSQTQTSCQDPNTGQVSRDCCTHVNTPPGSPCCNAYPDVCGGLTGGNCTGISVDGKTYLEGAAGPYGGTIVSSSQTVSGCDVDYVDGITTTPGTTPTGHVDYPDETSVYNVVYGYTMQCYVTSAPDDESNCDPDSPYSNLDFSDIHSRIVVYRDEGCVAPASAPPGQLVDAGGDLYYRDCYDRFNQIFNNLKNGAEKAKADWITAGKPKKTFAAASSSPQQNPSAPQQTIGPIETGYNTLSNQLTPFTPYSIVDSQGNQVTADQLSNGLSDALPSVQVNYSLNGIAQGQPVLINVPGNLPLQNVLLTPSQPFDGTVSITIAEGSKPQLLGTGAPGTPDFPVPDPNQYTVEAYVKIDTVPNNQEAQPPNEQEVNPWSEAILQFNTGTAIIPPNMSPEQYLQWRQKMMTDQELSQFTTLRYDPATKKWTELPTEEDKQWDNTANEMFYCFEHGCQYLSKSPGTSVFAIARKNSSPIPSCPCFPALLLPIVVFLAVKAKGPKS